MEKKKRIFTLEMVKERAIELGGQCLSDHYVNSTFRLLFKCGNGHRFRATPLEVIGKKSGAYKWCPKCEEDTRPF